MMTQFLNLTTPGGRIVAGSLSKAFDKDMQGKPRTKPQYFFALAVQKNHPDLTPLFREIFQHAWKGYGGSPVVQDRIRPFLTKPGLFAWKIIDGDGPKHANRPGHAGCWIFRFNTTFPIQTVGPDSMPIAPQVIKCGYYADVHFGVAVNGNLDHTAGVYLNPLICRLLGTGPEIVQGPDAKTAMPAAKLMGGAITDAGGGAYDPGAGGGVPDLPSANAYGPAEGTSSPNVHAPAPDVPGGAIETPDAPEAPGIPDLTIASPSSEPSIPGFSHGG